MILFIEDKECYETKLTVSQEKYVRELQKTDIKYLTKSQDKKQTKKTDVQHPKAFSVVQNCNS